MSQKPPSCEWLTHKETHSGKLESSEHLLLYNEIELAIKESKKEEKKTSGAISCGGYKSGGGGIYENEPK